MASCGQSSGIEGQEKESSTVEALRKTKPRIKETISSASCLDHGLNLTGGWEIAACTDANGVVFPYPGGVAPADINISFPDYVHSAIQRFVVMDSDGTPTYSRVSNQDNTGETRQNWDHHQIIPYEFNVSNIVFNTEQYNLQLNKFIVENVAGEAIFNKFIFKFKTTSPDLYHLQLHLNLIMQI